MRHFLLIIALLFVAMGCEKKEDSIDPVNDDFNRGALLSDLAELIEESHVEYNSQLLLLKDAISDFTNSPTVEQLQEIRLIWSDALIKWQAVAPFEFGQASNIAFESSNNIYPVDIDIINSNIDAAEYNLSTASNLKAIGLQTIDYMIYGVAESDEAIVDLYVSDEKAESRNQYLLSISEKLYDMSNSVLDTWRSDAEFRINFEANDGTDQGSSMGLFLNAFNKSFEKSTRTNKLGIPSGALTFSMSPNPTTVEAYFENNNSLTYLSASIDAFEKIYLGESEESTSLQDYLQFLDARNGSTSLDEAILNNFQDIREKIALMQDPLSEFLVSDQQLTLDAFASMQNLVVLWKVDMMSALGILITYQDNDGD